MRLLLDTHVAIWAVLMPERIPEQVRTVIANSDDVWVSVVAIWEIAIKHGLGRPGAPPFSADQAIAEFESATFKLLNVSAAHAAFVGRLPPIHADPFDRLLIAQALVEPMRLVTKDSRLAEYSETVITW